MILSRRSVLFGLIAAPIVVRSGLVMPVRPIDLRDFDTNFWYLDGIPLPPEAEVIVTQTRWHVRELASAGLMDWHGSFGG